MAPTLIALLTKVIEDSSVFYWARIDATTALGKLGQAESVMRSLHRSGVNSRLPGLGDKKIVENIKALFAFLLIGEILEKEGTDSIPLKHLANRLEGQVERCRDRTLSALLWDVEGLFRELNSDPRPKERERVEDWEKYFVDVENDYFDRRSGRPFRMLRKGKEAWHEVRDYFRIILHRDGKTPRPATSRAALDRSFIPDNNDLKSMREIN